MNVLLIVVGIVIAICIFVGYKKGLVRMIASLLAATLIVTLVGIVSPYISQWIQQGTSLKETVQEKVVQILIPEREEEANLLNEELAKDEQITLLENAKIPEMFRQKLLENNHYEAYAMLGAETFGQYVGAYITKVLSDLIAFLVALVVVTIAVSILVKMLGLIDKLPLIGGMNRVAGGIVGVGIGVVAVWILFLVITLFYDTELGRTCFEQIETSKVLSYLYDGNPFMKYIIKF